MSRVVERAVENRDLPICVSNQLGQVMFPIKGVRSVLLELGIKGEMGTLADNAVRNRTIQSLGNGSKAFQSKYELGSDTTAYV